MAGVNLLAFFKDINAYVIKIRTSPTWTFLAAAAKAESCIAFLSTGVDPVGTQINTLGFAKAFFFVNFFYKVLYHFFSYYEIGYHTIS